MFVENLDNFFTDFAEAAEITLSNNSVIQLKVIFDSPTENVELYDSNIEANAFFVTVKTSDIQVVKKRNTIKLLERNKTYSIENIRDNGTGLSYLDLK